MGEEMNEKTFTNYNSIQSQPSVDPLINTSTVLNNNQNTIPVMSSYDQTMTLINWIVDDQQATIAGTLASGIEKCNHNCFLDIWHGDVKVLRQNKNIFTINTSDNQEMLSHVEQFLDNYTLKAFKLCASLENYCLKTNNKNLKQEAAGQIILEEFASFQSLQQQIQVSTVGPLKDRNIKLEEKLKRINLWRRVTSSIFATAFAFALIFSVVAAAISAPPLVTALAGFVTVPIGSFGKWINNCLWNRHEIAIKQEKEINTSIVVATCHIAKHLDETYTILFNLSKAQMLRRRRSSTVEFVEAAEINQMKVELEMHEKTIGLLSKHAFMFGRCIRKTRKIIIKKIIKDPTIYSTFP